MDRSELHPHLNREFRDTLDSGIEAVDQEY